MVRRRSVTGKPGSWLRHEKTWDDFNLRLEYRLKPAGNSGVYIRVPQDGNHHGAGAGIEVQILDDQHPKYQDLKPYQYSGSLYAIEPAKSHPGRDPGLFGLPSFPPPPITTPL